MPCDKLFLVILQTAWYNKRSIILTEMRIVMKKVIVIGCPGSGKSTFSAELAKICGLPLHHLDMLYWNADKTTVSKEEFLFRLENVLKGDEWIIDGNYNSTLEKRFSACDTVFFLDYDTKTCLDGVRERLGKKRADMPWVEEKADEEFLEFIRSFPNDGRENILKLIEKYKHKNTITFSERAKADKFLNDLGKSENRKQKIGVD